MLNTIVGAAYRLLRPLGEGGMGTVYEAQHLRLGTKIAIKILSPQYAADPKFRDRFKREAKAASQIRHPNVVQITDFGETPNNSVFFAMELLEGHDLHHILQKHAPAPFPWPRAVHLLAQATDALAAAHRCGIIHRDVKPSNIFVLEGAGVNDFVKLLDFGIAKIVAPTPSADSALVKNLTGTGEIFGTAKYMAPEQAYGGSNDPRMDVYSLGVVAYELLTGRVPFTGQSNFEIITRHVYDRPRPLRELRPDLPAALEAVVLRAMEKKPENRFATMEELGKALRQVGGAGGRVGTADESVPHARTHVETDANTLSRTRRKDLLQVDPTTFLRPVNPGAAPEAAAAPVPLASVVRKTIPAVAAAPLPAPAAPAPSPVATPPSAHPIASPPAAPPFVASAPPAAASPTDNLARMQPPTGPLARRGGAVYDDTSRERAMRPPAASMSMGRLVALGVSGALVVGTLSATAVIFAVGSDSATESLESVHEPASSHEATLPDPAEKPLDASLPSSSTSPPAEDLSPPRNEPTNPASSETSGAQVVPSSPSTPTPTTNDSPEIDSPDVEASDDTKPPTSSPPVRRPSKPDGELAKDFMAKVKASCQSGKEKTIDIKLYVDRQGRVTKVETKTDESTKRCVASVARKIRFSGKGDVTLQRVLIKSCLDPFNLKPKCSL